MLDSEKENIIENTKNFTPYGTDPKKDKMVRIDDWKDRLKMAKEGYSLDVLINDKDYDVRKAVLNYLKDNNLTLAEWCNQNNKEIDLKNLAYSPYPEARVAAIKSGYVYKKDEIHIDFNCKFIPYGTDPKKDKMVKSDNWRDRLEIAKEGYGLEVLINDEDWRVRRAVARQGYGLDILVNDEHEEVRKAVAEQGYGLNVLINDEYWVVRKTVAKQGYGLDVLINDEAWSVRHAVEYYLTSHNLTLEQWKSNQDLSKTDIINTKNFTPYGTDSEKDKMVKSDDWKDRLEMAKEGYGLDVLINDEDYYVRAAVYTETRIAAIKSGYVYKENEIYTAPDCKFTPYGTNSEKDKMVKSNYWEDRLKMAKQGYGLDVLINDEDRDVRAAVARQGYGLDILVNDKDWKVRRAVAEQGYGLDILVNDEDWEVRTIVAKQGYGLDVLINDKAWRVRHTVEYYLTSHNLTLEQWKSNQDPSELSVSISKAEEFNPLNINTQKSEIQNLKDQINTLTKENKSLQKTLEKYVSVEKETDEKEL